MTKRDLVFALAMFLVSVSGLLYLRHTERPEHVVCFRVDNGTGVILR